MNYRKFLIAALLVMSFAVQAKDITVTRLTCEMREGRVTTSDTPRLMADEFAGKWHAADRL